MDEQKRTVTDDFYFPEIKRFDFLSPEEKCRADELARDMSEAMDFFSACFAEQRAA